MNTNVTSLFSAATETHIATDVLISKSLTTDSKCASERLYDLTKLTNLTSHAKDLNASHTYTRANVSRKSINQFIFYICYLPNSENWFNRKILFIFAHTFFCMVIIWLLLFIIFNKLGPKSLCKNYKGSQFIVFPYPHKPTYYVQCSHGTPACRLCPEGLIFNNKVKVCDFPPAREH